MRTSVRLTAEPLQKSDSFTFPPHIQYTINQARRDPLCRLPEGILTPNGVQTIKQCPSKALQTLLVIITKELYEHAESATQENENLAAIIGSQKKTPLSQETITYLIQAINQTVDTFVPQTHPYLKRCFGTHDPDKYTSPPHSCDDSQIINFHISVTTTDATSTFTVKCVLDYKHGISFCSLSYDKTPAIPHPSSPSPVRRVWQKLRDLTKRRPSQQHITAPSAPTDPPPTTPTSQSWPQESTQTSQMCGHHSAPASPNPSFWSQSAAAAPTAPTPPTSPAPSFMPPPPPPPTP